MKITLNGESKIVPDKITLAEMVRHFSLSEKRVAIELNKNVIRRTNWQDVTVNDGDKIEIVHFVGGG